MFTNFSQAQLAIVAYAEVSGADGTALRRRPTAGS